MGGFAIITPTSTAWASRLSGRELHLYHNLPSILMIVSDKACAHGADFMDVEEDASPSYMIVIQFARVQA
jgi:hypothetical protein